VMSIADEERKAPGAAAYRQTHSISLEYPFIVADNRSKDNGATLRALLESYADYIREVQKTPYSHNWVMAGDDETTRQIQHMLRLGMTKDEAIDFLAPRTDLAKRAEIRSLLAKALRVRKSAMAEAKRTAAIDSTINDWWHIGTQEELNQSQHTNDVATAKPFNLKTKKVKPAGKPKTYEEMLHALHDPEMNYQKTTEQLLKESRT
jgi:hypothetical protein